MSQLQLLRRPLSPKMEPEPYIPKKKCTKGAGEKEKEPEKVLGDVDSQPPPPEKSQPISLCFPDDDVGVQVPGPVKRNFVIPVHLTGPPSFPMQNRRIPIRLQLPTAREYPFQLSPDFVVSGVTMVTSPLRSVIQKPVPKKPFISHYNYEVFSKQLIAKEMKGPEKVATIYLELSKSDRKLESQEKSHRIKKGQKIMWDEEQIVQDEEQIMLDMEKGMRKESMLYEEDMELSASELSIYDKLSETIDLVRQTGYQCGMSEKAIEKFIKQLLEKNEPQRGPPRFPLLMVLYKGLVTLGVVLLTAYFMIQPYSLSPSENTLTKAHPWSSLFHHIRLLPLPITKKYMLEKCPEWWGLDCRQNMSLTAKCSCCCSMKTLVAPVDLRQLSEKILQGQPLLIKTRQHRSYAEMKHFQSLYPELTNFVIQEEAAELWSSPSKQQPPFSVFWQNPQNKSQILQEIFPIFSSLLFPKDISLKSCFLIHHPRLQDKTYRLQNTFVVGSGQLNLYVIPSLLCREHCKTLMVELEAGDIGFTNVDYWTTNFNSRGSEPVVVCDGSAS